jgi:hypothetical protein
MQQKEEKGGVEKGCRSGGLWTVEPQLEVDAVLFKVSPSMATTQGILSAFSRAVVAVASRSPVFEALVKPRERSTSIGNRGSDGGNRQGDPYDGWLLAEDISETHSSDLTNHCADERCEKVPDQRNVFSAQQPPTVGPDAVARGASNSHTSPSPDESLLRVTSRSLPPPPASLLLLAARDDDISTQSTPGGPISSARFVAQSTTASTSSSAISRALHGLRDLEALQQAGARVVR